jgi:protein-S-isoprenylcysteine O-methyltransferase Ste14
MTSPLPSHDDLVRKLITRTALSLLVLALLLFLGAGRVDWPAAWVYLGLVAAVSCWGGLWLLRNDPGLLAERLRPMIQRGQKPWDRALMSVMLPLWLGWLVLMGLDAGRYRWSHMPLGLQLLGAVLILVGCYWVGLVMRENRFAAPVVKIQRERGHKVVTTGPYRYMRHPMYAGAIPVMVGAPLLLGSWWGLLLSLVLMLLIAIRAVFEERTLMAELEGYADYARRVPYRLLPRLW